MAHQKRKENQAVHWIKITEMDKQIKDAKKRMKGKRRRRNRRQRRQRIFALSCVLLASVSIFATLLGSLQGMDMGTTDPAYGQGIDQDTEIKQEIEINQESGPVVSQEKITTQKVSTSQEVHKSRETKSPLLVIANKDYELSENYDPQLCAICDGRLEASALIYDDLTAMLDDAGKEGYKYWIASAYRSREYQQKLIDEDVKKFMYQGMGYDEALEKTLEETLPAGHSEHETGLSLDILCSGNMTMDISQSNEPGNQWLMENCAKYGFILRYPKEKEAVTGIAYEPWHFRYVGKEAAEEIMGQKITLEEYLWEN